MKGTVYCNLKPSAGTPSKTIYRQFPCTGFTVERFGQLLALRFGRTAEDLEGLSYHNQHRASG